MTRPERNIYSLYGFDVMSDFPFASALAPGRTPPQLTFACNEEGAANPIEIEKLTPVLELGRLPHGQPVVSILQSGGCDVLRYTQVADFYIRADDITCHLLDPRYHHAVEIYLLGAVMSYWLERFHHIPALHAAAVVIGGGAVGFLATNKGGKTSLAAMLMQSGCALLTDDILPVEQTSGAFCGRPGYPQMRMWPDQAAHFAGAYEHLELVHPDTTKRRVPVGTEGLGTFYSRSAPLSCLYVPERRDPTLGTDVEITPLPLGEAVMTMLRNQFLARMLEVLDDEGQRLRFFANLASRVPVRRLSYPCGVEYLPAVGEAILADMPS